MNPLAIPATFRPDRRGTWPRRRCSEIFRPGIGESGETMLEFAFVAPMLILLMLMIIDLGIMLMSQSLLDGAARDAARLVRTGQVKAQGNSITVFENQLCVGMRPIMSAATCQQQIVFEVQNFPDFGSVAFNPCTQTSYQAGNGTVCQWAPGTAEQIVGVRATYNRKFIVPWVDKCLTTGACWYGPGSTGPAGGASNTVPLVSTVVFKNEPFP